MKIVFKTQIQKQKEFNKKNYVWKKTFLLFPTKLWFIKRTSPNSSYYTYNESILWLRFMEKRRYMQESKHTLTYSYRIIVQYREIGDNDMEISGYYRNVRD